MKALVLACALAATAASAAEELVPVRVERITVSVPGSWRRSLEDGSVKYTAPTLAAHFLVSTNHTLTQGMDPAVCRKKILAKMGPAEAWTLLTIGGAPAARRLDVDTAADARKTQIETYTYVGCDGDTTWSLVFHLDARKKASLEPLSERIAQSVRFNSQRP